MDTLIWMCHLPIICTIKLPAFSDVFLVNNNDRLNIVRVKIYLFGGNFLADRLEFKYKL